MADASKIEWYYIIKSSYWVLPLNDFKHANNSVSVSGTQFAIIDTGTSYMYVSIQDFQ